MDDGELWSFFRRVLDQGRAIAMDERAGKYPTYEHLSARMDEAARERVKLFREECADVDDTGVTVPASGGQCIRPERSEVNAPAVGSHVTSPATQGDGSGDRRDGGPGAPHGWRACDGCAKPYECLVAGCASALLGSQPPARCHCGAFHIDGTSCEVTT